MNRVVLTFLAIALSGCGSSNTWRDLNSPEGKFKASFPGTASTFTKDVPSDLGTLKLRGFSREIERGSIAYMVIYSDYPPGHANRTGVETMLDLVRDGAVASVQGKLLDNSAITMGSHSGREYRFTGSHNGQPTNCAWRIYVVNDRLYQLGVVGIGKTPPQDAMQRFFDSFELLSD